MEDNFTPEQAKHVMDQLWAKHNQYWRKAHEAEITIEYIRFLERQLKAQCNINAELKGELNSIKARIEELHFDDNAIG